ncbi:hypothetical protein V2G26_002681 [Clonostachys chloroleuca]
MTNHHRALTFWITSRLCIFTSTKDDEAAAPPTIQAVTRPTPSWEPTRDCKETRNTTPRSPTPSLQTTLTRDDINNLTNLKHHLPGAEIFSVW